MKLLIILVCKGNCALVASPLKGQGGITPAMHPRSGVPECLFDWWPVMSQWWPVISQCIRILPGLDQFRNWRPNMEQCCNKSYVLTNNSVKNMSVTLWFRRLQCLAKRSVLSVVIDLRSAECVFILWTSCLQTNKISQFVSLHILIILSEVLCYSSFLELTHPHCTYGNHVYLWCCALLLTSLWCWNYCIVSLHLKHLQVIITRFASVGDKTGFYQ